MLTVSADHDTALTVLRDGASGYLVKGTDPERLEHALRAAAAGDVVLDHDMAQAVTELAMTRRRTSSRPFAELTEREFHILDLVAQGLDNQAIARASCSAPRRSATTCPTSSPSSTLRTAPRPSCSAVSGASGRGLPHPTSARRDRGKTERSWSDVSYVHSGGRRQCGSAPWLTRRSARMLRTG
jgi:hypothetical protein